jgi:hypothetical protein
MPARKRLWNMFIGRLRKLFFLSRASMPREQLQGKYVVNSSAKPGFMKIILWPCIVQVHYL